MTIPTRSGRTGRGPRGGGRRELAEAALSRVDGSPGYRSQQIKGRIGQSIRWRDVAYEDKGTGERIDPRTLTIALDDLLPAERIVSVDSGNFMGYPSMYLSVPDEWGFCFTQAFQSIGSGWRRPSAQPSPAPTGSRWRRWVTAAG